MKDPFEHAIDVHLPDVQPARINVGGIRTDVWGLNQLSTTNNEARVVIMFLLHGRQSSIAECESQRDHQFVSNVHHHLII
jgi:hypothetical protein